MSTALQDESLQLDALNEVGCELGKRGVQLRSLTEQLDTSTSGGRLLFHIFGSIAEFERDLIHVAAAQRMYDEKGPDGRRAHTVQQIAETVGVSRATIYKALQR